MFLIRNCCLSFLTIFSVTFAITGQSETVQPETLASLDSSDAGISFSLKQLSENSFEARFLGPDLQSIDTLELKEPGRLVFDFKGVERKVHKNFTLKENNLVSAVRVGSHPDRFRLVFDLLGEKAPHYSISASSEGFVVRFATSGAQQTARQNLKLNDNASSTNSEETAKSAGINSTASAEQKVAPESEARAALKPEQVKPLQPITAAEIIIPEHIRTEKAEQGPERLLPVDASDEKQGSKTFSAPLTKEKVAMITRSLNQVDSSPALQQILFSTLPPENTPVLELSFSKEVEFDLLKEDGSSYKLYVKELNKPEDHLLLPYFAPKNFPGLKMVRASFASDGILTFDLEIESPELKVSAFKRGSTVYIRANS